MSASLVGSEMCIRDREYSARRSRRCLSSAGGSSSSKLHLPSSDATTAVSYTHLTLPTICSV
eukprot:1540035-Alexandrium_andersonii.AAC.1